MTTGPIIPAPEPIFDASTMTVNELASTFVNVERLRMNTTGEVREALFAALRAIEIAIESKGGWIDWYRNEGDMTIHAADRTVLAKF